MASKRSQPKRQITLAVTATILLVLSIVFPIVTNIGGSGVSATNVITGDSLYILSLNILYETHDHNDKAQNWTIRWYLNGGCAEPNQTSEQHHPTCFYSGTSKDFNLHDMLSDLDSTLNDDELFTGDGKTTSIPKDQYALETIQPVPTAASFNLYIASMIFSVLAVIQVLSLSFRRSSGGGILAFATVMTIGLALLMSFSATGNLATHAFDLEEQLRNNSNFSTVENGDPVLVSSVNFGTGFAGLSAAAVAALLLAAVMVIMSEGVADSGSYEDAKEDDVEAAKKGKYKSFLGMTSVPGTEEEELELTSLQAKRSRSPSPFGDRQRI